MLGDLLASWTQGQLLIALKAAAEVNWAVQSTIITKADFFIY